MELNIQNTKYVIFVFQILKRYRFHRNDIAYILELIEPQLRRRTGRSQSLTPREQLLVALRFYATGSIQLLVGDAGGLSQSSVSRAINNVTNALVRLAPQHIKMPTTPQELREVCNISHINIK